MVRVPKKNEEQTKKKSNDDLSLREEIQEVHFQTVSWQAPMPPPEIVRGYSEVIENGGERLFRQFEIEAEHRRDLTRRNQTHQFSIQVLARISALAFALSALYVAFHAVEKGLQIAASIVGGGAIAMVVAAFTGIPALFRRRDDQQAKK